MSEGVTLLGPGSRLEHFDNIRAEYAATQDAYLHYDDFAWQVGSVLIAGTFVFWGFLLDKPAALPELVAANLAVCLLMTTWLAYSNHNRQIYLWKLHRLRELETELELWQHRRFSRACPGAYPVRGPRGHVLNYVIYLLVSLGGPTLIALKSPSDWRQWIPLALTSVVAATALLWVVRTDHATQQAVSARESAHESAAQSDSA